MSPETANVGLPADFQDVFAATGANRWSVQGEIKTRPYRWVKNRWRFRRSILGWFSAFGSPWELVFHHWEYANASAATRAAFLQGGRAADGAVPRSANPHRAPDRRFGWREGHRFATAYADWRARMAPSHPETNA